MGRGSLKTLLNNSDKDLWLLWPDHFFRFKGLQCLFPDHWGQTSLVLRTSGARFSPGDAKFITPMVPMVNRLWARLIQ